MHDKVIDGNKITNPNDKKTHPFDVSELQIKVN